MQISSSGDVFMPSCKVHTRPNCSGKVPGCAQDCCAGAVQPDNPRAFFLIFTFLDTGKAILNKNQLTLKPLLMLAKKDLPAANNLVRFWLKSHQLAMPSQERLQSWWADLKQVKSDSQLAWRHDDASIRLWRGQLQVTRQALDFQASGEWVFKAISLRSKTPGLSAQWVAECQQRGDVEFKVRQGSEKLQLKANTPRKTLKNLFQEGDIAPWLRLAPLLYIDGNLIAVAGLGVSYPHLVATGKRVLPEWVQNPVK